MADDVPKRFAAGQLALELGLHEGRSFDNFVAGPNEAILAALSDLALGSREERIFVVGEPACGKTHLLQAACEAAHARGASVSYLPMRDLSALSPESIEALGTSELVCIDDVDSVAGRRDWEIALLTLFEESIASRGCLAVTAGNPPSLLPFALADLASRLSTAAVYRMAPLDDTDRASLLRQKAAARGFELSDEVASFILSRSRRDIRSLLDLLERLDARSLAEQRRLTVPFVRSVIG